MDTPEVTGRDVVLALRTLAALRLNRVVGRLDDAGATRAAWRLAVVVGWILPAEWA